MYYYSYHQAVPLSNSEIICFRYNMWLENWFLVTYVKNFLFYSSLGKFGWFSGLSRWWRGRGRGRNISQEKTSSWLIKYLLGALNMWLNKNAATVQWAENLNQKAFSLELISIQGIAKDTQYISLESLVL